MKPSYQKKRISLPYKPIVRANRPFINLNDEDTYYSQYSNPINTIRQSFFSSYVFLCNLHSHSDLTYPCLLDSGHAGRADSLHVEPVMPMESSPQWKEIVAMQIELAVRLYGCDTAIVDMRRLGQKARRGKSLRELRVLSQICSRFGIPLLPMSSLSLLATRGKSGVPS